MLRPTDFPAPWKKGRARHKTCEPSLDTLFTAAKSWPRPSLNMQWGAITHTAFLPLYSAVLRVGGIKTCHAGTRKCRRWALLPQLWQIDVCKLQITNEKNVWSVKNFRDWRKFIFFAVRQIKILSLSRFLQLIWIKCPEMYDKWQNFNDFFS